MAQKIQSRKRPHSGKYCYGKTPYQTLLESKHIANEKTIGKNNGKEIYEGDAKRIQIAQIYKI